MEYVFLWVTPFPDDFWTKVVAACVVWPATKVNAWFQFRRDIAIRAAKQKREPHPFRKPQELVPRAVDGRTVDMRCIALTDGKPWTDVRFARLVNHRFDSVAERWNERITKMEYEANLMAEYREQTTRSEH
ncbi:uncharacterized protein B0H18DRAFT_1118930 [Fomitopsis serialis]|uniref:uncharacterized protein n=1 Tax=Fomitopsis serialis TaxID=139415 RepID=UPI002007A9D8|nr:uncharacterized protein B0H18DRAFT_1118930 [Neoantrodia serialis]KAH9926431.1 hypothetical protein B0H18DRAFT_1118930 [Neoantrodia serialis]